MISSEEYLQVYSNGYHMDCTMRGTLDILPIGIYVKCNSITNILSIKEVTYYLHVTIDTKEVRIMLSHYSKDKAYLSF